jgi:hypothetical protein
MKCVSAFLSVAVLLIGRMAVFSQGNFINLGFESTTITPVYFPGGDRYVATIPGWGVNTYNTVNGDTNSVDFNDIALAGGPLITLHDRSSRFFQAIQGNYSVLLQAGSIYMPHLTNGASISQTGQIPLNSQSITYWGSGVEVFFNGQALSSIPIIVTSNYTVWGADISAYAGQSGELRFTAPWQRSGTLDGIQFSTTPIPEPRIFSMVALGGLLLAWRLVTARLRDDT